MARGGALWLDGSVHALQMRDRRLESQPRLNLLWCCVPRQGPYLHMHSLNPGVSGYLVGQGRPVCLNSFCGLGMTVGMYAPQGVEMV